jgi:hypothetical protein
MHDLASSTALAAELSDSSDALRSLTTRVRNESESRPRIDTSEWSGPASWACQLSLTLLAREIEAAAELLRCAADLTAAAAWEVRGSA